MVCSNQLVAADLPDPYMGLGIEILRGEPARDAARTESCLTSKCPTRQEPIGTMTSQTVKEMFGQLVANYSHMTGNYDLLREAEIFLSVIPAMLDEKGVLEEYYSTLADLEARYDQAVGAIDDRQGGWKLARMQLRYIRKVALTIALKEDLIVLRRDMVSLNSMNADLQDPE